MSKLDSTIALSAEAGDLIERKKVLYLSDCKVIEWIDEAASALAAYQAKVDEARANAAYWVKHHGKQAALVNEYASRAVAAEAKVISIEREYEIKLAALTAERARK